MTTEIRTLYKEAGNLPAGKRNRVQNMLNKISIIMRKSNTTNDQQTHEQIVARYNAQKAIYEAMTRGRKISLLDSQEFRVSEMHTQIHCIRRDIERKQLPYRMCDQWIEFGAEGKRCKQYWLEAKEGRV